MHKLLSNVFENDHIKLITARANPVDYVTAAYQLIMMLTIVFYFSAIPFAGFFITFHLLVLGFLYWLVLSENNKFARAVHPWNPLIIIPLNFSQLHYLVHPVNPIDWDDALVHLDYSLFGVHPTVWLESWSTPWLTEYFQIIYTTFYFLPLVLAIILFRRDDIRNFNYFVFIISYGFYISYLGYFMVPALGPRFTLHELQTEPLLGLWLTNGIRDTLNWMENIQRDAFPSGHTEITVLTMIFTWKFSKPYFWILSIVGSSLLLSTVYLRYHYVVDVFAGVWLALFVLATAPTIFASILSYKESKQSF
jgi:membrane-associated phospholipid phosphatase